MPRIASIEPLAAADHGGEDDQAMRPVSFQEPTSKDEQLPVPKPLPEQLSKWFLDRLSVPQGVPGWEAPKIKLPDWKKTPREQYSKIVDKYFPPLPGPGSDPEPGPSPNGKPLTLEDLQKLAFTNSPLLRQAASDVEAARGAMIQAGAYPNPTLTYLASSHGPSGGPLVGAGVSQTIKTTSKLKLAQGAAAMDLENARLAYRRAETDLMATVRSGYFAVLVAQESIRANRALVQLTDEVYKVMVQQLKGGEVATYEPLQLGVFATQARAALIQSRNSYTVAWKQLAASLGLPGMPPAELAGRIDMTLPLFHHDAALAYVLANHTDVKIAENGIQKARLNLSAAEVTAVPDVTVSGTAESDNTPPGPAEVIASINVGVVLPVWDLNKGAIRQAQAALLRANEEPHRVRDDLSGRVADAFRRFDENRALLDLYRRDILPQQVQAFRAAVLRHYGGEAGAVAYADLVASEQNLVSVIGAYLPILGAQWQAVVDVASLLQTDDLFQLAGQLPVGPLPNLKQMLALPCTHPCSPLPQPAFRQADFNWLPGGIPPAAKLTGLETAPPQPPNVKQQATTTSIGYSQPVVLSQPAVLPTRNASQDINPRPAAFLVDCIVR
jgi:cobalt-zinc-cadmium efflux system outer membrane protein